MARSSWITSRVAQGSNYVSPERLTQVPRQIAQDAWYAVIDVRNTALQAQADALDVDAQLTFDGTGIRAMRGRWTSQEPVHATGPIPDRVDIKAGHKDTLDVAFRVAGRPTYALNTDVQKMGWQDPDKLLEPGTYTVEVSIQARNSRRLTGKYSLSVTGDAPPQFGPRI